MGLVLLVVATAAMFVGAGALVCWSRSIRVGEAVLQLLAFVCVAVMLETLLFGVVLHSYRRAPLTLGALVFAAVGVVATLRGGRSAVAAFRLDLAALGRALGRARSHPLLILLTVLTVVVYALRGWLSARLPPVEFDSLMYHLIGPDRWVQTGRIGRSPENVWVDSYPLGVETLAAWPVVFLRSVQYSPLALLPTYLMGGIAIFSLARGLRARTSHAVLVALLFLLTPAVFTQASTSYVDATSASFGLTALALTANLPTAVRLAPRPGRALIVRLVVIGAVIGAGVAAKSSNLAVAGVLVLGIVFQLYRMIRRRGVVLSRSVLVGSVAAVVVPAFVVGGYWYVRTWVNHGNPLYPVTMLGFHGLGSVQQVVIGTNTPHSIQNDSPIVQVLTSWGDAFGLHGRAITYDERLGALGIAWPLFVLPAALIGLVVWARSARRAGSGYLCFVMAVAVFASSPAAWWGRYVLAGFGALLPLSGYALTRLGELRPRPARIGERLVVLGVTVCLVLTAWWGHQYVDYVETGTSAAQQTSGGQIQGISLDRALQLSTDPKVNEKLEPWAYFKKMDLVPAGSRLSLLTVRDQAILQPLVGLNLQRRLVILDAPSTSKRLAAEMHRAHSRYVMIDDLPELDGLIGKVAHDSGRFDQLAVFSGRGVLFSLKR